MKKTDFIIPTKGKEYIMFNDINGVKLLRKRLELLDMKHTPDYNDAREVMIILSFIKKYRGY